MEESVSNFEKNIYNTHLAVSRRSKGKPFTIRKNFDDLGEEKVDLLKKLKVFFERNPSVDVETFFKAPYETFPDEKYYDLEFYTKPKAVSIYTQYAKSLELENPDSDDSLKRLQKGFKFISQFCEDKGLTLEEYMTYSEGNLPCYLQHLKDHKINFYLLHSLEGKVNTEKRILDFMFGDFYSVYQKTRNKFITSKKMKKFSKLAKQKIESKLKKTTTDNI